MAKTVPWNIKGVGFDAREIAHMAARRAGVPLGEWLNGVICERAQQLGVTVEEFSADDRLDALVARLAGVAESARPGEKSEEARADVEADHTASIRAPGAQLMSNPMVEDELPEIRETNTRRVRRTANGGDVGEDTGWAVGSRASRREEPRRGAQDWDNEMLLDQAIELVGRRSSAAEERASGERQRQRIAALAREVERASRTDFDVAGEDRSGRAPAPGRRGEMPRPLRDAMGSVAERIGEIENRIASRDADNASRPIVAALSRLEDRFEHLLRRNSDGVKESAKVEATFRDLDGRLRELAARLDRNQSGAPSRSDADRETGRPAGPARHAAVFPDAADDRDEPLPPRPARRGGRDAIADITQRQADLESSEQRRAALMSGTSHASMEQLRREAAAASEALGSMSSKARPAADVPPAPSHDEIFGSLNQAFARLTERLEARLDEAARARAATPTMAQEDIGVLKTGIAALGTRLDSMKEQVERTRTASPERDHLEALRNEIAALQVGLAKLAPQSAITTLENAVRDLGEQIDDSRRDGVSDAVLAPLERLRTEVRQAVEARDLRAMLERIEDQLGNLSERLVSAKADTVGVPDLGHLEGETKEIRALLQQAAGQFEAVERLEVEIGQLGARVERLTEAPPRSAVRDLELGINEIRTMLVEFSPDTAFRDLSRKLDGFAERFGALEEQVAAPAAMFDDFARRMEDAHAALADRLVKAAPVVDLKPIHAAIGGLSGKIDGLRHSSADLQALGGLVRGLAAQIEDARLPSADAKILDSLETQVGRLAERLDRSDASLDAISSVERLVRDLFQQLDDTRTATIDAAETAARTAAQETLRAALVNPALAGDDAASRATLVVEQVGQELTEFRKAQQTSEKRVHATLMALNETLERMVDRMVVDGSAARLQPPQPDVPAPEIKAAVPSAEPVAAEAVQTPAPVAVKVEPAKPSEPEAAKPVEIKRPAVAAKAAAPAVEIGRPALAEPMPDVSPLIAAARRAAQAAQTSANELSRKPESEAGQTSRPRTGTARSWPSVFKQKRRPILLSVASVVLLLGALQVARLTMKSQDSHTVEVASSSVPTVTADTAPPKAAAQVDSPATAPAPTSTTAQAPAPAAKTASLAAPSASGSSTQKAASATTGVAPSDAAPKSLAQGLRDMADRGDPAAEAEVGARLAEGRGLARDPKAAASWFERSAKQKFAPAEYRLGSAYEKGTGVAPDPTQALSWYEKAAAHGNIRAMHNLAVMAAEGSAGKADYTRAATWFTRAAEHGVRDSQYNLAILYARGLGLSQDLAQSYTWFAIAADQGDADAAKKRDDVAAKLDADKLSAAKAAAAAFKPQPVDRAANDIAPPPGGWDVASPASGAAPTPKLSSM